MNQNLLGIVISLLFVAGQYVLSKNIRKKYLGAILPIVFAVFMFYQYMTSAGGKDIWGFLIIVIVGESLLLEIWDQQTKETESKTKKELDKIKAKNRK